MLPALLAALLATAPEATTPVEDPTEADVRAQAKAAFQRGRAHAREGAYDQAVVAFEEALRLRPTPGLHYNIAVCHHRQLLALESEDAPEYEQHRAAAVQAYNAYLDAAPEASDRYAVAATIQDLHGRPNVIDEWRVDEGERASLELRTDDAQTWTEPEPETTPEAETTPAPVLGPTRRGPPARTPMRPGFPHGMLGFGIALDGVSPVAMSGTSGVDSLPALGPVLRGGGYIGDARELLLGAELALSSTPTAARRGHRLTTVQMLVLVEWARALTNDKRLELGVSGTAGIAGQAMAHDGPSPASCPVRASGIVSTRGGAVLGGRLLLRGLFGDRRQHAVGLRVGPTFAGLGGGSKDSGCIEGEPSPFKAYGFESAALMIRADVGYAFRW